MRVVIFFRDWTPIVFVLAVLLAITNDRITWEQAPRHMPIIILTALLSAYWNGKELERRQSQTRLQREKEEFAAKLREELKAELLRIQNEK